MVRRFAFLVAMLIPVAAAPRPVAAQAACSVVINTGLSYVAICRPPAIDPALWSAALPLALAPAPAPAATAGGDQATGANATGKPKPARVPPDRNHNGDVDCGDFTRWKPAQRLYEADTSDPYGLDGPIGPTSSGQAGVACEDLPGAPA